MRRLAGRILTPDGFVDGTLPIGEDGRVASVSGDPVPARFERDGATTFVLPGFVDLHVHGGGGTGRGKQGSCFIADDLKINILV